MKTEKFLWMIFFILICTNGYAQRGSVEVKGQVVEEGTNEPVEQATVRLLSVKDSTFVGGVASGRNGDFSMKNIKAGDYILHISFVGFSPLYQPLKITGRNNPVNVGRLEMSEGGILLSEAVVVAKAAEVVVNNDTIEYNADSYKVVEGSMLEDLLKKMPGVEVDSEGKITVNGKEISKILVDGKEFFSDDPKVASKNLPAQMIEKVQTYEKKSDMAMMTGFDDGNEENVINLTIKPGMKKGWFGNAYAGYGNKDRYEANGMVNHFINNDMVTIMGGVNNTNNMGFSDLASTMFSGMGGGGGGRRGGGSWGGGAGNGITTSGNLGGNFNKVFSSKLTLNGNARYSHSDNDAWSNSLTENFLSADSSNFEREKNIRNALSNNWGANFRMEWKPDSMTQIIFRPDFSYSLSRNHNNSEIDSYDRFDNAIYDTRENSFSRGEGYNLSGQLEFSRKLNNLGRVLSVSLTAGHNERTTEGDNYSITNYYQRTNGLSREIIDQVIDHQTNSNNYRAYVSWVEPLGRNNFLQATYSFQHNKQESLKNTFIPDSEGLYNLLDTAYSQSYENTFITQRASLSFRAQREKYNYMIGMNVDPSYSKSHTFVGDNTISDYSRTVINLSPTAQFNYMWDRRTNLRVNYYGRTTQPTVSQLNPTPDITSPTNTTQGNPDLKPSYSNNVQIRYQKFVPERMSAFTVMSNFSYTNNAIVSNSKYADDGSGNRISTYENVNGNYDGNVRLMMNSPLKNNKFTFNTMAYVSYNNSNGFVNGEKNTSRTTTLSDRIGFNFLSEFIDLGINGNIQFRDVSYTLQSQTGQNTLNYGAGGFTTIYLPLNFKIESDINYSGNSGYSDGYKQKEVLWNASASKTFLKNNQGTLRFKFYDILHQRSNISRSATANYTRDTEYNTLSSYFMVHFIYRFSIFTGGAGMGDAPGGGERRGPRPGGGGPGGPPRF